MLRKVSFSARHFNTSPWRRDCQAQTGLSTSADLPTAIVERGATRPERLILPSRAVFNSGTGQKPLGRKNALPEELRSSRDGECRGRIVRDAEAPSGIHGAH
jgi:hypothetical protein